MGFVPYKMGKTPSGLILPKVPSRDPTLMHAPLLAIPHAALCHTRTDGLSKNVKASNAGLRRIRLSVPPPLRLVEKAWRRNYIPRKTHPSASEALAMVFFKGFFILPFRKARFEWYKKSMEHACRSNVITELPSRFSIDEPSGVLGAVARNQGLGSCLIHI
jgi:hypothetical protein